MILAVLLGLQDPAALVERLGSDDIEARQRAEAELARLGACAEPALDVASRNGDPEVSARARRLLLDIVAPHRREVDQAVRHLLAHLRAQIGWDNRSARILAALLKRYFPDHPLSIRDELVQDAALPWIRQAEAGARFTYPSHEAWMNSREDIHETVLATFRAGMACSACTEWRLHTVTMGFTFENARVEDILAYLKDVGGVTVVLADPDARFDHAVTVCAQDVTLGAALEQVLAPSGMTARVTAEGVVLVERRPEE